MNTAQVSSKKPLPTIINSEKQSPELMLSIVRHITPTLSVTGSIQYAHRDQKVIVKYVCRVHVTWRAFIFMYFPSNGHFPEPKLKIHSMIIKSSDLNWKIPEKSRAQVLMAFILRRPDMLRLQVQTSMNVPSSALPYNMNLLFLFLLYYSYFHALLFGLHFSSSPSTQLFLGTDFLHQGILRLWKALP